MGADCETEVVKGWSLPVRREKLLNGYRYDTLKEKLSRQYKLEI